MSQTIAVGLTGWMLLAFAFDVPTGDDVFAMMANIPPVGAYVRTGHAREVADAIASEAHALPGMSLRDTDALLAVYAAKESANTPAAVGDGGKALGVLQLQLVDESVALDPRKAIHAWLARAEASIATCAGNDPDERLAAVVSGNCDHGRVIARARMRLARAIARGETLGP